MKNMGMAWVITCIFLIVSTGIVSWWLNRRQSVFIHSLQKEKQDLETEIIRYREEKEFVDGEVDKIKETLSDIAEIRDLDQDRLADLNLVNEQLRIAIDETDLVNRSMGEFVEYLSREIQLPASAIIGLTDLTLNTQLTPEQRKNISIIKESAHSILFLMDSRTDILNTYSMEAELQKTYFSINSVMDSVMAILSPYTEKKGIDLSLRINHGIPPELYGDQVRLRQILIHLVSNAVKFTQRGKVVVSVEEVPPDNNEASAGDHGVDTIILHFSVSDTGTGISEDKLDRISESFHQTDGSSARAFNGTGLELGITDKLVRLMGGEIWNESKEGEGNTFHFTSAFTSSLELKHQNLLSRGMEAGETTFEY